MMKGLSIGIIVLISGAALFGVLLSRFSYTAVPSLMIEGVPYALSIAIADTPTEREQGLSGRRSLSEKEGMLFLFDSPGKPAFWMKDMLFSIDIIWIGSDWRIVDMSENFTPQTYPKTITPQSDAQYVLEVPAGFVQSNHVSIGQSVIFKK